MSERERYYEARDEAKKLYKVQALGGAWSNFRAYLSTLSDVELVLLLNMAIDEGNERDFVAYWEEDGLHA
jgi:TctA family transporter